MAKIDNAALKKGGFMAQKQKGFYSLRLHITAGHLDSRQLIGISKVADAFGHGYIHLTSRQAIEIPFINVEDADAAYAGVAEALHAAGRTDFALGLMKAHPMQTRSRRSSYAMVRIWLQLSRSCSRQEAMCAASLRERAQQAGHRA